ncbi:glycosyl hydrolase family 28-related protein [Parapedobacter sp. 2B3]|uniref:right-handed parallel beta-helix repeat-containing protein n=1 Tax=Parapedobacter sp. 2B3 TaxID=3342381 RepID=UPI0035B5E4CF
MKSNLNVIAVVLLVFILTVSCTKKITIEPDGDEQEGARNDVQAFYNIVDFGADSTGVGDSSPAFDAILSAAIGSKQIEIYIPSGRYRIEKRIVIDSTLFFGFNFHRGLIIRGVGQDVTELICDNNDGGLYFKGKTNLLSVTVRDMSIVANREGKGTAIEFDNVNPGDHHSRMLQVKDVLIRGEKHTTGYFQSGIKCYNAWYPSFERVEIAPRYGAGTENLFMDYGIFLEDSYSPLITSCYIWGKTDYGIFYRGNMKMPEDGIIDKTYIISANHGVYIDLKDYPQWSEPAFRLTNSHINYRQNGIFLKGVRQVTISDNLFYCQNKGGSIYLNNTDPISAYESIDVNCQYASDVIIANNHFTEPASPKRVAIAIGELSAFVSISNNHFNFDALCIRNESTSPSYASANVFGGKPDFRAGNQTKYEDVTGTLQKIEY